MLCSPDSAPPDANPAKASALGLIGSGGHARVAAAVMARLGLDLEAVFDIDAGRIGGEFRGIDILAQSALVDQPDLAAHIAIGSNAARRRVDADRPLGPWLTLIDPSASLADDVALGEGVLVNMGARIQTGVVVGRHSILNTAVVIDHDCEIGDFVHVAPGAVLCGEVRVASGVLVGAGAVILPGVRIGEDAVIGAGAVVTRDVASGATVVGSPARVADAVAVRP